jgi:hypothetical protein
VLSVAHFSAQQQVASSVTNPATHSKVLLSVAHSVPVQVPSMATPKTRTNTKIQGFNPFPKNRKA